MDDYVVKKLKVQNLIKQMAMLVRFATMNKLCLVKNGQIVGFINMQNRYKYGIFRKNDTRPIIKTETQDDAEKWRRTNFIECEVRPL